MRALSVLMLSLLFALPASAANRYAAADGNWNTVGTWNDDGCGQPADASAAPVAGDAVILCPGITVTLACNNDATMASLTDAAGAWSTIGGGLVADHSACSAGQVGQLVFDNASMSDNTTALQIDDIRPPGVFTLKGRQIYTDEKLGLMEFTPAAGCAAAGSCWETKWPVTSPTFPITAPASVATAMNPTTYTSFGVADSYRYIRMLDGQHVNDVFVVESATTSGGNPVMRFTPGAIDDYYSSGFSPSLKMARDSALDATPWTTTSPRRTIANITTGTIAGTYYHEGQCLVVDPQTRYAANRPTNYYRIAASIDGGAGVDQLLLDPWMVVAAEDTTGAVDADIVPCLKPGDRFEAWEPITLRPAVAGSDAASFIFTGMVPVMEGVYAPNTTPAYSTLTSNPTAVFTIEQPPAGSSITGPVAQIGLRHIDGDGNPQVLSVYDSTGFTVNKFSGSGYYRPTPVLSNNVWHFLQVRDGQDLVLDGWAASWGNNECVWNDASTVTGSTKPDSYTLRNGNCHQLYTPSGEVHPLGDDVDRGITCNRDAGYPGAIACQFINNMIWSVATNALSIGSDEDGISTGIARDNVVGYTHPFRVNNANSAYSVSLGRPAPGGTWSGGQLVNNVILTSRHTGGAGAVYGIFGAQNAYYNYVGENQIGVFLPNTNVVDPNYYGMLFEAAGSGTTMTVGINFKGNGLSGTFSIRDMVVRRLCNPAARRVGIYDDTSGAVTTPSGLYDWTHLSIETWCPEYAGNAEGASVSGSAAVRLGAGSGETVSMAGSTLTDWLLVNGDHGPDGTPADEWATYGVMFGPGTGCSASCVFARILCSTNRQGTTTGTAGTCLRNPGAGYTITQARQLDTYPEALGIRGPDDLRLRKESLAYAAGPDDVIGARYAGIIAYTSAMENMDIPQEWLVQRAYDDAQPDLTVLPLGLRGLYSNSGGAGGGGPNIR